MSEHRHTLPADIENASMDIIRKELEERGAVIDPVNEAVVMRAIHATADFDYLDNLVFVGNAVESGIAALRAGKSIVSDTNMAKSGINDLALRKLGCDVQCYMAEEEIVIAARIVGVTRAVASMRKAARDLPDAIYSVGNAPTALFELCNLIEKGLRPPLVIGVPVGFVNVIESKERLLRVCREYQVPAIIAMGRKGGSTLSAAICNALLYSAIDAVRPENRQ